MKLSQRQLSNSRYSQYPRSNFSCETPGRLAPIGYRPKAQIVPLAKITYKLRWHQSYSRKMAQDLQWKYSRIRVRANRRALNYHWSRRSTLRRKYLKYWNATEAAFRKIKKFKQKLKNLRQQIKWIKIKVSKWFLKSKLLDSNKGQGWKISCSKAKSRGLNSNKRIRSRPRYLKTAVLASHLCTIQWRILNSHPRISTYCNQLKTPANSRMTITLQPSLWSASWTSMRNFRMEPRMGRKSKVKFHRPSVINQNRYFRIAKFIELVISHRSWWFRRGATTDPKIRQVHQIW